MKTLLFIDHIFHKRTRSFEFLVEILEERFIVRRTYIDPAARFDSNQIDLDADYIVVAQVDFISAFCIMHNKKVIVIQMYDGSYGLPDDHWALNRQARYINFSQALHAKAINLGCESLLVKYAPNPEILPAVESYDQLRCFFWNRLPDSAINTHTVGRMLKGQLSECHVHLPRDDDKPVMATVGEHFDCPVTTSKWFENKKDFDAILNSCNVFVAPRIAEGIGHSFLDAMARGMLVLAWDIPTHTEYISNWHNGVLFNGTISSVNFRDRTDLAHIGQMARLSIADDFKQWQIDKSKINDFIETCPPSEVPSLPKLSTNVLKIINSYRGGVERYRKELIAQPLTVNIFADWRELAGSLETTVGGRRDDAQHVLFGMGNAKYFAMDGFSDPEELFTWTTVVKATLEFPAVLLPDHKGAMRMQIRLRSVRRNTVTIQINDINVAIIKTNSSWSEHDYVVQIPPNDSISDIVIKILCEKLVAPKNDDHRSLGVAIERISIYSTSQFSLLAEVESQPQRFASMIRQFATSIYDRSFGRFLN